MGKEAIHGTREWRMVVTGIWNNTVLIQRPRSAPYIGGKGRSHATEHNWFHSVNLLEQRKYLVLFISYERSRIPRYTGCTRAGQFREFEKREKRVRLSELLVHEKWFWKGRKKKTILTIKHSKCSNIDSMCKRYVKTRDSKKYLSF